MNFEPAKPPVGSPASRIGRQRLLAGSLAVALSVGLTGCQSFLPEDTVIGPSYKPANVFCLSPQLPNSVRRVAILPITALLPGTDAEAGQEALQPVLLGELGKSRAFEVVSVTPDQLKQWTGRATWTAEELLPPNLLKTIRESLGCQAVLFTRLTHYRPYKPPAVGWNIKLVDCQDARIWWSIDEVFDAGNPPVANAARRYYQQYFQAGQTLPDSQTILNSPSRFGQYTLSAALATLPAR